MSDNSIGRECLVHYNNQHIQVRKDFFDLCAYDKSQYNTEKRKSGTTKRDEPNQECMAKILRLLETLTNSKKGDWFVDNERLIAKRQRPKSEPEEYRIELAYSTVVKLLYNTYGESTVRNSVAALIQRNFIKRYQETTGDIPQYVLNISALQSALEDQRQEDKNEGVLNSTPPQEEEAGVLKTTARGVNSTPSVLKTTATLLNSTPNNISSKKDLKKENNNPAPTSLIQKSIEREKRFPVFLKKEVTKIVQKLRCMDLLDACLEIAGEHYLLADKRGIDQALFRVKLQTAFEQTQGVTQQQLDTMGIENPMLLFFDNLRQSLHRQPIAQEG